MSSEEQAHRLRISVDVQSIRNNNFQGNIYVKYSEVASLGIKKFKTPSTVQLFKKHIEEQYITDGFCSYEFDATKEGLLELVRYSQIDQRRKTCSGDQTDDRGEPVGKLGELRVIIYLEDLGPSTLLAGRMEELVDEYRQETDGVRAAGNQRMDTGDMAAIPTGIATEEDSQEQKAILRELADIESKVIWELENWKRAEEARFRFNLKQKEAEFVEKMRTEWKQKELDREKVFKETENKMMGHMQKMQGKVNQLSKRENRLILLEEELKQKIVETSRQLAQKDEQVDDQKIKVQEEKKNMQKKMKELEDKNKKMEDIIKNLEEDLRLYKIEQEKSPIEIVKRELNERVLEIAQLRKEVEKTDEIKEEYRKHFDRLKDEVIKLKRKRDQAIIDSNTKHDKDINLIRNQLANVGQNSNQGNVYSTLREELLRIKGGTGEAGIRDTQNQGHTLGTQGMAGFSHNSPQYGTSNLLQMGAGGANEPRFSDNTYQERPTSQSGAYKDPHDYTNIRRLMNEKAMLLKQGYTESDPLVLQIDETIKQLKS